MKRFLKCVERILMAVLSAFASVGAFVLINLIINLVSDEPLSVGNMGIWFMVSMILVYCLNGQRKGADFCDCCGQALDWGKDNGTTTSFE